MPVRIKAIQVLHLECLEYINNFDDLCAVLDRPERGTVDLATWDKKPKFQGFDSLGVAITKYNNHFQRCYNFYSYLLPRILQWASEPPAEYSTQDGLDWKLSTGAQNFTSQTVEYSAATALFILANAFLLNQPDALPDCGSIDLTRLLHSKARTNHTDVAAERTLCFLAYFWSCAEQDYGDLQSRKIIIERRKWSTSPAINWSSSSLLNRVHLISETMETSSAPAFVDFANAFIHIHRITPSATQEEVLFSCAPEAFISIIMCSKLEDDEVVVIHNVQRVVEYTGYLDTFAFTRVSPWPKVFDIIAMDACMALHYSAKTIERDVLKAVLGFMQHQHVVTGHWGCGVFGGNPTHKFLQQWIAASQANLTRLDYSVYGDTSLITFWNAIQDSVLAKGWNVRDVMKHLLVAYEKQRESKRQYLSFKKQSKAFEDFVATKLGIPKLQ